MGEADVGLAQLVARAPVVVAPAHLAISEDHQHAAHDRQVLERIDLLRGVGERAVEEQDRQADIDEQHDRHEPRHQSDGEEQAGDQLENADAEGHVGRQADRGHHPGGGRGIDYLADPGNDEDHGKQDAPDQRGDHRHGNSPQSSQAQRSGKALVPIRAWAG
jgi:hypothetical protein